MKNVLGNEIVVVTPLDIIEKGELFLKKPLEFRYIVMYSGGKDSTATALYVSKELGFDIELVYCNTGIGTEENVKYVRDIAAKYNWKLHEIYPDQNHTYEKFIERFGFPKQGMHMVVMNYLKYKPLKKFYKQESEKGFNILYLSGRRKSESQRRKRMKTNKDFAQQVDGMTISNPLYYWNHSDVLNYLKNNNISLCSTYETLHLSGDCLCGAFSRADESKLISIFHQNLAKKIKELEIKYNDRWGNGMSMKTVADQSALESYICNECIYSTEH